MMLYTAPNREDNYTGDRDFAYQAEVDILGWKFRKMGDGKFIVETPRVTLNDAGHSLMFAFGTEHQALLAALMALTSVKAEDAPMGEAVGRLV